MTTLRTACPLDCPDTCSLSVEVHDGRLVSVDAAPADDPTANPLTAGFICHKVKRHARRVYAPERITTPLVRTGPKGAGEFRAATWDEALDLVATEVRGVIDRHGPAAVVPYLYSSSAGRLAQAGVVPLLWEALGAAEVEETICAATAGEAWERTFGSMPSTHPAGLVDAGVVLVWGANPAVSNTHLPPLVAEARRRGATVVVVDPRRTATASRADLHVAVRPGTDVALALAVAAELDRTGAIDRAALADRATGVDEYLGAAAEWTVERAAEVCGIPGAVVQELVSLLSAGLATDRPVFLRVGWGLERNRNGGSSVRAVLALAVLAGNLGATGSGVLLSASHLPAWDDSAVRAAVMGHSWDPPRRRRINMNRIGAVLAGTDPTEEPVHLLFVQGSNPAATAPNQSLVLDGLARDDLFCVVHEQVMTDTARHADVVLPATTHFEADDLAVSYGAPTVEAVRAVIERVGESRTNAEVAAGLAARLGFDPDRWDPARVRSLALPRSFEPGPTLPPGDTVPFRDVWPSWEGDGPPAGDRRARLVDGSGEVDRVPVHRELGHGPPLTLLTPSSPRTINSMFGEWNAPTADLRIHPDDAADRGIVDGDTIEVANDLATLVVQATVDTSLRKGVCAMPKGLWCRSTAVGLTANALVPDALSDLAGGACFNDARVEVRRVAPA